MIGVIPLVTTLYGLLQTRPSRFTIHVQPVGVYLTVAAMAFGQRPDLLIKHTIVQTKECRSASVHLQQLGTLLRVIAAAAMSVSTMSAAAGNDWWVVMLGCFVMPGSDRASLTTTPLPQTPEWQR